MFRPSRARVLALMLVVLVAASSAGAVSLASAAPTTSAAAKKSKKCKKGYKKVNGRCKKKKKSSKAAPKPETVVSGATLNVVRQVARTKVQLKGSISFSKTPARGTLAIVVNITTESAGNIAAQATVKVDGESAKQSFTELSIVPGFENGKDATLSLLGVTYNTVPVT